MLSDAKIRGAKASTRPQKLTDSGGLYLEVRPSGAKLWRYRYRIGGVENVFALGEYARADTGETEAQTLGRIAGGRLTLADARAERDRARSLVKRGIHPAHQRSSLRSAQVLENANIFEAVAREWIAQRKTKWSPRYFQRIEKAMATNAYPYIGHLPMRSVSAADLLEIIKRVEKRDAPTVAILMRQWFSAIFRYAVATLRADGDPAAALKGAVEPPKAQHSKPLARKDIPAFLKALEGLGGHRTTGIAVRILMLTFVRTKELRAAEWDEIDLDRAEWRIPADRMKMREPHIVPLSNQVVALLRELHDLTGGQRYLFPNSRRRQAHMTDTTVNHALVRMGYGGKFSGHGFRATASTMLNELGYHPDLIERQLAHADRRKVRAIYNQAEYLSERAAMMQGWADLIDQMAKPDSNVTPIKRSRVA